MGWNMTTTHFDKTPATRRKAKRENQYASTLVHYLGIDQALEVCRANMWNGVRQAILEQQGFGQRQQQETMH